MLGYTIQGSNVRIEDVMALPTGFRPKDFLSFHGRDKLEVSERVTDHSLQKAIVMKNSPALLGLDFSANQVRYSLAVDNAQTEITAGEMTGLIRHMLGLNQAIEQFEQAYADHPLIGAMVAAQSGLRVPVSVSPYEALTWAIIGQQVSLSAAISMRRKFIQLANIQHSSGLYCYPSAAHVARLSPDDLRQAGLSQAKAAVLITVSQQMLAGDLPLDQWLQENTSFLDIADTLSKIKGIGPWTISYTLLRGYGWLDGSLHGDAAVRRAIRGLMAIDELNEKEAEHWLKAYQPWRALLAAHLWAWPAKLPILA
jgi:DNA-3-methyladenine glycosylase II